MKALGAVVAFLGLLISGCAGGPQPQPDPSPSRFNCDLPVTLSGIVEVQDPVPNRYIVVMKPPPPGIAPTETSSTAQEFVRTYGARDVRVFDKCLNGFACRSNARKARQMAKDPRVAFVQQEGRKQVTPLQTPQSHVTWGLDRVDQRDLPLDDIYDPGASGAGVHAYVIDTGLDVNHQEFTGRVGEGYSATGDGIEDDQGHGTHVAGTIGGTEFGIAKQVILHPVRVLVNGSGSDSDVIEGVEWVTGHMQENGWPAVVNMSLGGPASPALDLAICSSIKGGMAYVVASGNEDSDACNFSPARIHQALGTGASTRTDSRASFSNKGACVDLFAPGQDITAARSGGGTMTLSGTSMASPHVAGVASLCLERNLDLTPEQVRQCVLDHASRGKLTLIGEGSPNRLLYARDD